MRGLTAAGLALATALTGACTHKSNAAAPRTLTVFAASSLTAALTAEGTAFERTHHEVRVRFSFAGSQALVAQIRQGAPADVLATADTATMTSAGLSDARVFARNRLAIVTARDNPKHVGGLADLSRPGLRVVLAGPTVPVGKAARKALSAAGVKVTPLSLEQDVKGVVAKVRLGEADAGIAYQTDLQSATDLSGVPLPAISNSYPVAVVKSGNDARAFADFLLSAQGQSVLRSFGFLPPA